MRTTLDIPQDLIEEAQRLAKTSSKTATIIMSLEELIRAKRIERLRKMKGRIDLAIDLDTLRRSRTDG